MTIKQFIEKAIKGGWRKEQKGTLKIHDIGCYWIDYEYEDKDGYPILCDLSVEKILLDPLAWQAVGKVEGWSANYSYDSTSIKIRGWGDYMHQMINALAEGKTIEEFLKIL